MGHSKPWPTVVALGERIVHELGLEESGDTLGCWMAHRVAELMERAETAEGGKNGTLLSGMCVPDLQGTQGSFSFYSTVQQQGDHIGGQQYRVVRRGNLIESKLKGPPGKDGHPMRSPFTVELDDATRRARITVGKETVEVGFQEYTPWLEVPFCPI